MRSISCCDSLTASSGVRFPASISCITEPSTSTICCSSGTGGRCQSASSPLLAIASTTGTTGQSAITPGSWLTLCRGLTQSPCLETRKKRGLSQLRIGCLLRPWLPRRQRRAPFLVQNMVSTWRRRQLRGSHLDQDQVSLSSQPPVFPGLALLLLEQQHLSTKSAPSFSDGQPAF